MNVIVCLDDNNGRLFNHRRQSRDRAVTADICSTAAGHPLYLSPYSAPLFEETDAALHLCDHPLAEAGEGDYCFDEQEPLSPHLPRMEQLIVYRWNRDYPYDVALDTELTAFTPVQTVEFAGYSHETITKTVYQKKE